MASGAGFNVVTTGVSIPSAKLQPYPAGSGNSMTGTMSLHQSTGSEPAEYVAARQQESVVVSQLLLAHV